MSTDKDKIAIELILKNHREVKSLNTPDKLHYATTFDSVAEPTAMIESEVLGNKDPKHLLQLNVISKGSLEDILDPRVRLVIEAVDVGDINKYHTILN